MEQGYAPLREASNHIVCCEFPEAESILEPYAAKNNVTALTLLAEAAWIRSMISEDKADQAETIKRLTRAEAKAHQGCDYERTGIFTSLIRLAIRSSGSAAGDDSEWSGKRARELSNATNLAYIYLMQALSLFRGSAKGYISGLFKLKAAWRMYKQLWEREILKQPPGILSSLSLGSTNFRGSMVHADSADHGPPDDDEDDNLAEQGGKVPGSSVVICDDSRNEPVVGVEDVPAVSRREEGVSVFESDSGEGTERRPGGEEMKGVVSAEEAEEEALLSILSDVNYGIGGFHFFVGLIPSSFRWIVESLGFRGDHVAGRQELQSSMGGGGYRAAEALLLVFWMDTFYYKDRANAEQLLLKAGKMFEADGQSPSPLFQYMGGYLARLQGHLEEAVERFEKARGCAHKMVMLEQMCDYEIGWCHYLRNDFPQAEKHFRPFLATFEATSYRAYCSYQLGCALDIMGRHEEAAAYMGKVAKLVRKHYTFDQFAARKAAQYLKLGELSAFDQAVIFATNHLEAKHYTSALARLPALRKCVNRPTIRSYTHTLSQQEYLAAARGWEFPPIPGGVPAGAPLTLSVDEVAVVDEKSAMYTYLAGKVLRGIGRKAEAKQLFQRVVEAESLIKEETFVVPYSYCEIGELLVFEGRATEAKVNLRTAQHKYQNYDFDKPLGRRIKLALDNLTDSKKR